MRVLQGTHALPLDDPSATRMFAATWLDACEISFIAVMHPVWKNEGEVAIGIPVFRECPGQPAGGGSGQYLRLDFGAEKHGFPVSTYTP